MLGQSHRLYKETGDLHPNPREAQRQRREHALDRQRSSRAALFDLSRTIGADLDDSFEDLDLDDEESGTANEVMMEEATATSPKPSSSAKPHRLKRRLKWQKRFANKLQQAETLLDPSLPTAETPGLPADLQTAWFSVVVPKGKRCLALVLASQANAHDEGPPNTLLLSRVQGRPITRRRTALPANTILDCIYDAPSSMLWVLDALEYAGMPLSGSTAEMRRFFRDSKMAELPPQLLSEAKDRRILVAPAPASDDVAGMIMAMASGRSMATKVPIVRLAYPEQVDSEGMVMDGATTTAPTARPGVLEVPIDIDGALLHLREALYESGTSCLAGWLPVEGGALAAAAAQLSGANAMTT